MRRKQNDVSGLKFILWTSTWSWPTPSPIHTSPLQSDHLPAQWMS